MAVSYASSMKKLWLALPMLLASTSFLFAQLENADTKTKAECANSAHTSLPAEAALVPIPKRWPACSSYKLYSGVGVKSDWIAAHKCAWSERLATQAGLEPRYTIDSVFGGSAMLTVLYANGEGTDGNIPLAIRFACEAGGAPAEIGGRIEHLESMALPRSSPTGEFKFCDDITSGFMMGFCAASSSEIDDQIRMEALKAISRDWTAAQKSAFQLLLSAKETYAEAHARGEVDLSGTARAMYEIEERDGIRDNFLTALKSFETGALPKASPDEASESDARLNYEYRRAMADAEAHKSDYGAIQPEGIRNAERTWLKYRVAWVAFGKTRYPSVSEFAWLKLLSDDRVLVLQGKCCSSDPDSSENGATAPRPLP
jgi:hypothetical protein